MKKYYYLSLILLFAFSFQSMAQGFTNYKAVVSDNAGNILTNQNLDIRFTIYDGDPGTTGVQIFQETHNTTTDDNGIVVVNIGEIEVADWFNIDWSGVRFYLQTEYNIGSGFVDMGTQVFHTVPYAQYAHKSQYSIYSQHANEVDFSDITNVPAGLSDGDDDTHLSDAQIAAMGYIKNADDADHDATNELQNLTLNNTQLSISNGNNVSFSGWDIDVSDDVQSIDDLTDAKYIGLSLFIGEGAGAHDDGTNNQNVGVGRLALNNNTTGNFNTTIGVATLVSNTTGNRNTANGVAALNSNTTGNNNTALGYFAGKFNQTGSGNVFLGYMAGSGETGSNKLYIENSNSATPLIGGDFSTDEVTINGSIAIKDGTQGANKILTSDADGNASWEDVSTNTAFSGWDTDASDDFSGNYNDLANQPITFYEMGGTTLPDNINDDIYHTGRMFVGKNTTNGASESGSFEIENIDDFELFTFFSKRTYSSGGTQVGNIGLYSSYGGSLGFNGIRHYISTSGDGYVNGIYNYISGTSDGVHSGVYNRIFTTGSGERMGVKNSLESNGTGDQYGVKNVFHFSLGSGKKYGTYTHFEVQSGSGRHYGTYNKLEGNGNGNHIGVANELIGSGGGNQIGIDNDINNDGAVSAGYYHIGTRNTVRGDGGEKHFGTINKLNSNSNADKVGVRNSSYSTGNGDMIGVDNYIDARGSGEKIGVNTEIYATFGSGNANQIGIKNKLPSLGTGDKIGVFNIFNSSSGAIQLGIYNSITSSSNSEQYGVRNELNVSGNTASAYGTHNIIGGSGNGTRYGTKNSITNSGNGHQYGTYNYINNSGTGIKYGTFNKIPSSTAGTHIAVYGEATKTGSHAGKFVGTVGINKNSTVTDPHLSLTETGSSDGARIMFKNSGASSNSWTLWGKANNTTENNYFNIYHTVGGNILVARGDGKVGIKRNPVTNTLEVNGTASKSTAGSWLGNSDRRLKTNIQTIDQAEALKKILALRGVTYEWNDHKTGNTRPTGVQYGFIAQELMEVFPSKVSKDNLGYYQTAYGDYDPLFVQAIKELSKQTKELKDIVAKQQELIEKLSKKLEELERKK